MQIRSASQFKKQDISLLIQEGIRSISASYLKNIIHTISTPRNYIAEKDNNQQIARWIRQQFEGFGYQVCFQGNYDNVVAMPQKPSESPFLVAATHYDTVPGSPGADDNGSGIAVLLACAKVLSAYRLPESTIFVLFNREEEGLLGSREFVQYYLAQNAIRISEVHVLEMVGYCSHEPGSQSLPPGLPVRISDIGNFLGIIANHDSKHIADILLKQASTYLGDFPVTALKVWLGMEKYFPHLRRSDHAPFWDEKIPALMWTDTSEFRNPYYHTHRDTPDTLDFTFMKHVAQLLLARILAHERDENL